jgi:subtilisin family serine protease
VTARVAGPRPVAGVLLTVVATAVSLTHGGIASAAPTGSTVVQAPQVVKDSYIVVLKNSKVAATQVDAAASRLGSRVGARVKYRYSRSIRGFSATMDAAAAQRVAADPDVERVEPVVKYRKQDTQTSPTWGLDRIDEYSLPLDRAYTYPGKADTVHAYVVDSGIRASHAEFQGRVGNGADFVDYDGNPDDCDGHGTHVAGTIGGATYGVAKGVRLHSVRVLDCYGDGSTDGIIAGIDWVTANAIRPAVVNLSFSGAGGTAGSLVIDTAITASILTGLTYTVAAGNDGADACRYSPGDVPGAITVGATDPIDYVTPSSNAGGCVDIFAPGVDITSANLRGGAVTRSGTSMSAPHVAGAAALLLAGNPLLSPSQVAARLQQDSGVRALLARFAERPAATARREQRGGVPEPDRPRQRAIRLGGERDRAGGRQRGARPDGDVRTGADRQRHVRAQGG